MEINSVSVRSCYEWGLHSQHITILLVSSYLTVSPLPACAGGLFSVTLAVRAFTPVPRLREESCSVVSGLSSPFCGANASTVNDPTENDAVCFGNDYVVARHNNKQLFILPPKNLPPCFSKKIY